MYLFLTDLSARLVLLKAQVYDLICSDVFYVINQYIFFIM